MGFDKLKLTAEKLVKNALQTCKHTKRIQEFIQNEFWSRDT